MLNFNFFKAFDWKSCQMFRNNQIQHLKQYVLVTYILAWDIRFCFPNSNNFTLKKMDLKSTCQNWCRPLVALLLSRDGGQATSLPGMAVTALTSNTETGETLRADTMDFRHQEQTKHKQNRQHHWKNSLWIPPWSRIEEDSTLRMSQKKCI